MLGLSTADRTVSPPLLSIPRNYNAAFDLLESNLRAGRGAKVAFIDDQGTYTYGELTTRVKQFAQMLGRLGIEREHRVLVCLQDSIDFPVAFLGCIWAGVIPVAVNTSLKASDYKYLLEDSRARALVVSESLLPQFEPILPSILGVRHVITSPFAALLTAGQFPSIPCHQNGHCAPGNPGAPAAGCRLGDAAWRCWRAGSSARRAGAL